jgi:exosortase
VTLSHRNTVFALFSLLLVLVAHGLIVRLITLALGFRDSRGDMSHILLIPLISGTLIYFKRQKIFCNLGTSIVGAGMAFAASATLFSLARTFELQLGENDYLGVMTAALLACWLGAFLLVYGSTVFKAALFPLLFLTLAIPIPHRIVEEMMVFLQRGSADLVSILLTLSGTPFYRNNMVFTMPTVAIEVADACSGIRSTIGMVIITLLAAHSMLRSNWKRVALLIAVIPVSLLKNAVRIVVLTLLAIHFDMGFLTGNLHHEGGILFMLGGLGLMYPLLLVLASSETKHLPSGVRS